MIQQEDSVTRGDAAQRDEANLRCDGQGFEATRVVQAGGRKVGLIGIVGKGMKRCQVSDPAQALTMSLQALGPVDLTVLVINADRNDLAEVLAGAKSVDFVVAGGAGQTLKNPKRLSEGPWQLGSGNRGKKLGILELTWKDGATGWQGQGEVEDLATRRDRYRLRVDEMAKRAAEAPDDAARRRAQVQRSHYQIEVARLESELAAALASAQGTETHLFQASLVELDSTIPDHPRVADWVTETKVLVNALAQSGSAGPAQSGPFVGSGRCSGCHTAEYQQWKATAHATAWPTLVDVGRQGDVDCVSCHATGHWHAQGPTGVPVAPSLRGVGCEDCHGPGEEHVVDPVRAEMVLSPDQATCVRCHDGVRDEGRFEFDTYRVQVVHGGG
jgi:hypothetical protein